MSDLPVLDEIPIVNPDEFDWPAFTTAPGVEMVYRLETMSDLLYNLEEMVSMALNRCLIASVRHAGDWYWVIGTAPEPTADTAAKT